MTSRITSRVHQRVYRMGLEHLGIVVGEEVDAFSREHRAALTGQQFQGADCEPYYVLFEDFTHVKFYRHSLYDVCVLEGATFAGFVHVDDWVPQRTRDRDRPGPVAAVTAHRSAAKSVVERRRGPARARSGRGRSPAQARSHFSSRPATR
jgi:hypothetical protein